MTNELQGNRIGCHVFGPASGALALQVKPRRRQHRSIESKAKAPRASASINNQLSTKNCFSSIGRNHYNLCAFAARACHAKGAAHLGDALLHSSKTKAVMIPVDLETNSVVLKLQTDLRSIETEPGLEARSMG